MTDPKALRTLGSACLLGGALAWVWSFFATQPASSLWHLRGAPGAIDALALRAWITGLVCVALGRQLPAQTTGLRLTALLGTLLTLGAHTATAATGWLGVQLVDTRGGARGILVARVLGGAVQLVALALGLRALHRSEA